MSSQEGNTPEVLERQIWQMMKAGKLEQAAAACDQLNQTFPDYGSGWNTSSRLAITLNEPVLALRAIQRALLLSPGKPEWLVQKMASLAVYGDLNAANILADEIADHQFETAYHASTCAVTLNRLQRFADAERQFSRAVELNPNNPNYRFSLASAQRSLGKTDDAAKNLDKVIELDPLNCEAQLLRSGFKAQTRDDNNIDSLLQAIEQIDDAHPGRVQLHYALAKEFDDTEQFDKAFSHYQQGAALRRSLLPYEPDADLETIRLIQQRFDGSLFENRRQGFVTAEPIFVIGMPRAGTALIENILANHPVVRSVGESQNFGIELVDQCEKVLGRTPTTPDELIAAATEIDFAALGEAYYLKAKPAGSDIAHFIDRQPINFMYAGLIHLALPNAKIVLVEREPVENCFTAFKTLFPGAYPYSYDLRELANYYLAYAGVMGHWQSVMPGIIHRVAYEDVVQKSRSTIEDLLQYCDLSFDDACFDLFSCAKPTKGRNPAQLRQKRREEALGHWRNYETHLQPLIDVLTNGPLAIPTTGDSVSPELAPRP